MHKIANEYSLNSLDLEDIENWAHMGILRWEGDICVLIRWMSEKFEGELKEASDLDKLESLYKTIEELEMKVVYAKKALEYISN